MYVFFYPSAAAFQQTSPKSRASAFQNKLGLEIIKSAGTCRLMKLHQILDTITDCKVPCLILAKMKHTEIIHNFAGRVFTIDISKTALPGKIALFSTNSLSRRR